MTMETLPVELQECIYMRLHVRDRVMFRIAMPKDTKIRYNPPFEERKLGILAKSIQKRKIPELSTSMKSYLRTVNPCDPTLDEIAEVFPNVVVNVTAKSFEDLIHDGTVTEEDVRALLPENLAVRLQTDWVLKESVYKCKPHVFEILIIHPDIRHFVDNYDFLFCILNYANEELIIHLKQHSGRLGFDVPSFERSLIAYIISYRYNTIFTSQFAILAIRHLPFTRQELERMWIRCLENMNMDAVEMIDRILNV